jgi:hypothetical protein
MIDPENSAEKQGGRFQKGQSGNPSGKPLGTRNKATRAMEALLDGESEAITRKAIELALSGAGPALRLCLERLLPVRRDRPVTFSLPVIDTASDAVIAAGALITAVAEGELTPIEAAELGKLIDAYVKALEASEFDRRLTELEQRRPA